MPCAGEAWPFELLFWSKKRLNALMVVSDCGLGRVLVFLWGAMEALRRRREALKTSRQRSAEKETRPRPGLHRIVSIHSSANLRKFLPVQRQRILAGIGTLTPRVCSHRTCCATFLQPRERKIGRTGFGGEGGRERYMSPPYPLPSD